MNRTPVSRRGIFGAVAATGALAVAGCSSSNTTSTAGTTSTPSPAYTLATGSDGKISLSHGWVVSTDSLASAIASNASMAASASSADAANSSGDPTMMSGTPAMSAMSSAPMDASQMSGMSTMSGSASSMEMDMSASMSAAYGVITNSGSEADALVKVTSPAAADCQLHTTVATGNGASMMKQVDAISVPANGTATLQIGGFHIMMMKLTQDLKEGETVSMTWTFQSGASITADFPVISRANRPGA